VTTKSARRRSREFALQGLYSWLLSGCGEGDLASQFADARGFDKCDKPFFLSLLQGTTQSAAELEALLQPLLDRKVQSLSPVERAILMLAAWELKSSDEVPYRVVINEAVELAKTYGGTDGHKYVNGVLDKLARSLREAPGEAPPQS
jgi:N utilization substance protein B